MTREAKLETISRLLQDFQIGDTIAEYANRILDSIEDNMKGKGKKGRKGC